MRNRIANRTANFLFNILSVHHDREKEKSNLEYVSRRSADKFIGTKTWLRVPEGLTSDYLYELFRELHPSSVCRGVRVHVRMDNNEVLVNFLW